MSRTKKEIRDAMIARMDEYCPDGLSDGLFFAFPSGKEVWVIYNKEITVGKAIAAAEKLAGCLRNLPAEDLLVNHGSKK